VTGTPPPPPGQPGAYGPAAQPFAPHGVDVRDPRSKSPALACILSILPGLGQIYVGYYVRGFVHAIVAGILMGIIALLEPEGETYAPFVAMFITFFWFYNIIDAGRKASLLNLALAGRETIDLPTDFTMPAFRGSIGAGLILVGLGFVALLHTRWGVSLEWIREWWPLLPIGLGAWLIVKAMQDRAAGSD
jgi:TM2 domain-containing membrane protein YozV